MSEWVKCESKVIDNVDKSILSRALDNLSLIMDDTRHEISNPWGKDTVDCGLYARKTDGQNHAVKGNLQTFGLNFTMEDGKQKLSVSGDFWNTPFRDQDDFINQLSQQYNRENIKHVALLKGYQVESENILANGSIEMMLYA